MKVLQVKVNDGSVWQLPVFQLRNLIEARLEDIGYDSYGEFVKETGGTEDAAIIQFLEENYNEFKEAELNSLAVMVSPPKPLTFYKLFEDAELFENDDCKVIEVPSINPLR